MLFVPGCDAEPRELCGFLQGVVVFFPSFSYADEVYEHWQASGAFRSLSNKKHVFREPRSAVEVDAVLRQVTRSGSCRSAFLQHILRRTPPCWDSTGTGLPLCCGSLGSNGLCTAPNSARLLAAHPVQAVWQSYRAVQRDRKQRRAEWRPPDVRGGWEDV